MNFDMRRYPRSSAVLTCAHLLVLGGHVWILLTKGGRGSPDIARVVLCLAFAAMSMVLALSHVLIGLWLASGRAGRAAKIFSLCWAALSITELLASSLMAAILAS